MRLTFKLVVNLLLLSLCVKATSQPLDFTNLPLPSITTPMEPLNLCSEGHNVFFLLDISGSIQGKKALRRFDNQRRYTNRVMEAFGTSKSPAVRFAIAAYSRYSSNVRALTNPRSNEIAYMQKPLRSFNTFKTSKWDSARSYAWLTRRGKILVGIRRLIGD